VVSSISQGFGWERGRPGRTALPLPQLPDKKGFKKRHRKIWNKACSVLFLGISI
jgi:hypothetical protein